MWTDSTRAKHARKGLRCPTGRSIACSGSASIISSLSFRNSVLRRDPNRGSYRNRRDAQQQLVARTLLGTDGLQRFRDCVYRLVAKLRSGVGGSLRRGTLQLQCSLCCGAGGVFGSRGNLG